MRSGQPIANAAGTSPRLRSVFRFAIAGIAAVLVVAPTTVLASSPLRTGARWSFISSPNPTQQGSGEDWLASVACPLTTACMAVGSTANPAGQGVPLAERWDGANWTLEATPSIPKSTRALFQGVSCPTTTLCLAVGWDTQGPLIERWTGTVWKVDSAPRIHGGSLYAVACTSASACSAVGDSGSGALAERWNGLHWSVQPTPTPPAPRARFMAVSCPSAVSCTAVGTIDPAFDSGMLAENWNGSTWSIDTLPLTPDGGEGFLSGVSCVSVTCTADGYYLGTTVTYAPLVDQSVAGTWSLQTAPNPAGGGRLDAVACSATTTCTAVGEVAGLSPSSLAERWNGTAWTVQATPATPFEGFSGVACPAAMSCTAVGQDFGPMLAETWNGTAWAPQTLAEPTESEYSSLTGVSCTTPAACTAVGWSYSNTLAIETWAERWNGTHWKLQSIPEPAGQTVTRLSGLACPTVVFCLAVGTAATNPTTGYYQESVAEMWDGTTWSVVPTPNPSWSGVDGVTLTAITCTSSTACTAVGTSSGFINGYPIQMPVSERWNGSSWTIQVVPLPSGALSSALTSVSCAGMQSCMAVGAAFPSTSGQQPQAAAWNGSAWTAQMLPVPTGAWSTSLTGVSCSATNACTAVGTYRDLSDATWPVIERWNGSKWSIEQAPSGSSSLLTAVSCPSASDCIAVADVESAHMVDHWNGRAWKYQSTPLPPGRSDLGLVSVSCPTIAACMAVGFSAGSSAINITLTELYST